MNTSQANFLIIAGLLLTMGGVGGIETSENDVTMLSAAVLAVVGLLCMYCGVIATRVIDSYK
jgi:hypothetical protein